MPEICRDLNELHPKVKELALKLLEECKKQGIDIRISETYRTVERQDFLYAQGRSRGGPIVTNSKGSDMQSYHQWRLAFDIYNNVRGNEYNDVVLAKAGQIGVKLGLEWGGTWKGFTDSPHFQYSFGLSIKDLRSGKKPAEYQPHTGGNTVDPSEQEQYEKAVKTFEKIGVIGAPLIWLPEPSVKYFKTVIIKIGSYLFKSDSYEEAIKKLIGAKIINAPELWLTNQYKQEHVKALMIKISTYIDNK